MSKTVKFLCIVLATSLLPACSWIISDDEDSMFRDRQADYLRAPTVARMDIPMELDSYTIDDLYVIPPEPVGDFEYFVQPPPPKPIDTRVREGVVVQRFGDRSWIVIGATSGQIWPRLRDFFPTEGIPVRSEDPVGGRLETVWLADSDVEDVRHRYQVRIEPGLHAGNSEIYVRHVSDAGESGPDEPARWPDESESLQRENNMLAAISLYLADRSDLYRASSVSLLAGSIEAESKANIVEQRAGDTRLELRIDMERAWSQVNQALNNAEIEILDQERDDGRFDVRFSGAESADEPGFFARLFRRGGDEPETHDFSVRLSQSGDAIMVDAGTISGGPQPRMQDLLIRTINDNLI